MSAAREEHGSDEGDRREVMSLRYGLCAVFILREPPPPPLLARKDTEREPAVPWPPPDWQPQPW